ncbi:helix-turn-helix domain-containing protein [Microbacterium sp.]|uniref:helix-turn-helix domain-containing protein n=1 Tax=Microbacterium sp. TaxID=51671 RepID=UPI0031FF4234|nr:helix-turn-helix domain-containing protein [Microbacterium sp.]
MPTRTNPIDDANRWWRRMELDIGDQLRTARHLLGVTQKQVATALGISQSDVSRRERARAPRLTGQALAGHAAAVGLKLSIKLWPVGGGVRDEAQARYIARFLSRIGAAWRVILEAPIPKPGDLRAVDILLIAGPVRTAVEVITRLADLQAQLRAAQLKARDIGATRLVIVVAGTHANRDALRAVRSTLVSSFELDARRVLTELAAGRDPGRDAVITL